MFIALQNLNKPTNITDTNHYHHEQILHLTEYLITHTSRRMDWLAGCPNQASAMCNGQNFHNFQLVCVYISQAG